MMQPDDPPFLSVGTEVSAKYKGAFCEAKVNRVVKNVKVKVTYKQGHGSTVLSDDSVKGMIKVGAEVKAFHADKGQLLDGIISKIQDCSQYTVVFDDGDITTLRRNSLCLKSGRHFAESETLDQLPLTHPEHFGTPVIGSRRGRRSRQNNDSDDGSSEEETNVYKRHRYEWSRDIGKVVCVEIADKKKQKDNWFPGLVVAPTAQDTVKIETKKDFLVRSFQDGRYYTVPKKEASKFSKDAGAKVTQSALKIAVEKAILYINQDELPPHWGRDQLFGFDLSENDKDSDFDTSDDEPREEKDHFVAQLYKYMEECGTPINKGPFIAKKDLDLYKLFKVVQKLGGYNRVMNQNQWKIVSNKMAFQSLGTQAANLTKAAYKRYLHSFDDFYRKLGCTMVSSPRSSKVRHRSGRSLIRVCDKTPRPRNLDGESGDSQGEDNDAKKTEEKIKKVEKKEVEKIKEEIRSSRNRTPTFSSRLSPCRDKLRTPRVQAKAEAKALVVKKETPKETKVAIEKDESASEGESETGKTRSSLRHRDEPKEKDDGGRKRVRKWPHRDPQQRSTSCNSNSSGTSCSSVSLQGPGGALKIAEKKVKVTRGLTTTTPEELLKKRTHAVAPTPEDKKPRAGPSAVQDTKKRSAFVPVVEEVSKKRAGSEMSADEPPRKRTTSAATPSSVDDAKKKTVSVTPVVEEPKKKTTNESPTEEMTKRGRKRKLSATDDLSPLKKTILPPGIMINVGDKLLVLYGPNRDEKITYEAKVLKVNEKEKKPYYVHYLGWNTRYDEWVERSRVAQNQTWRQTRSRKMLKQNANKEKKDGKPDHQVAGPSQKIGGIKRSRSSSMLHKDDRQSDSSAGSSNANPQRSLSALDVRKKRKRRLLRTVLLPTETDSEDFESEAESELNSQEEKNADGEDAPPMNCGKDINMKEIESEMKGLADNCSPRRYVLELDDQCTNVIEGSLTFLQKANAVKKAIAVKLVPAHEIMSSIGYSLSDLDKTPMLEDDVYEFKEPEPFEIGEIRSRKESKAKSTDESDSDGPKTQVKLDEKDGEASPKKSPLMKSTAIKVGVHHEADGGIDLIEPVLKVETNKELKDYTRRFEAKEHPKPVECKKEKMKSEELDICSINAAGGSSPLYEVLNQGRRSNIHYSSVDTGVKWDSERAIRFELDSDDQKLDFVDDKSKPTKIDSFEVDLKIDPVPIKSAEPDFVSPQRLSFEKKPTVDSGDSTEKPSKDVKSVLSSATCKLKVTDKSVNKSSIKGPTGHVLPSQIFTVHSDSGRSPSKSSKLADIVSPYRSASPARADERIEGKLLPFSQRRQHIFPHLLGRTDPTTSGDDITGKQKSPPSTSPHLGISSAPGDEGLPVVSVVAPTQSLSDTSRTSCVDISPSTSHTRSTLAEGIKIPKALAISVSSDGEKSKCETSSIEETIEAVVLKARLDQMHADEEEAKIDQTICPDKGRRNPGRIKKMIVRDYPADTSEESETDCRYDSTQQSSRSKRPSKVGGESISRSPAKRAQRPSIEIEKQFSQRCADDERANDADEEDNESAPPVRGHAIESAKRKLDAGSADRDENEDKIARSPARRRRSVLKKDENEEPAANLLCEETFIPGSPMTQDVMVEGRAVSIKQEMPFASVPTGSSFEKRTLQPQPSTSHTPDPTSTAAAGPKDHTKQERLPETGPTSRQKDAPKDTSNKTASGVKSDENVRNRRHADDLIDIGSYRRDLLLRAANQISSRMAVVENTPPTAPDSLLSSTSSGSPQRENEGSKAYDTVKSGQSSELEFDNKIGSLSEDWDTEDGSSSNLQLANNRLGHDDSTAAQPGPSTSSAKRKRSHSSSTFMEGDENNGLTALSLAACASGRSRYNFMTPIDSSLDTNERISELQDRMRQCRAHYLHVKNELALVERRKKKIRKKAKEKAAAAEQGS